MAEKCFCGEDFIIGMDGIPKCRNGHQEKKPIKHSTYPLGDSFKE